MNGFVEEDVCAKGITQTSVLPASTDERPLASAALKGQTAAEKQRSLDLQIESWNAFHAEHGLLSDEFSML